MITLKFDENSSDFPDDNTTLATMKYTDLQLADVITESVSKVAFAGLSGFVAFDYSRDPQSDITIQQLQSKSITC